MIIMILTTTLNPSVDISYRLDTLKLDDVNRVADVSKTAGGKGLNVARVLKQLDEDVAATGYLGGKLGDFISEQLFKANIEDCFVNIADATRNCIAIIHEGNQTEILESGPEIQDPEITKFIEAYKVHIKKMNYVTISGSLPKGVAPEFYAELLQITDESNVPVLLDTSGKALEAALKSDSKPFLIKPNIDELAGLIGKDISSEVEIIEELNADLFADIPWIVVTLGSKGAIIKHESTFYRVAIPKVEAVNPVGSGDSVIAGFAAGFNKGLTGEALMKYGLAMGTLNAMEAKTGHIDVSKIDSMLSEMTVSVL